MAKGKHSKKRVHDISLDVYPVRILYCPTIKVWEKQLKRMKVDDGPAVPENAHQKGGFVRHLVSIEEGHHVILVYIGDNEDAMQVMSSIVHESVHVWQYVLDVIKERNAGMEPEAYAVETIYCNIVDAYTRTVGKSRNWMAK